MIVHREVLSDEERERLLEESRHKWEWDNAARMKDARAEGRAEGTMSTAKNLLKRNRPIDEIMEDTGLHREEIEALR